MGVRSAVLFVASKAPVIKALHCPLVPWRAGCCARYEEEHCCSSSGRGHQGRTGYQVRRLCNNTVKVLEEQVSPVALRELSYPAQLEAFINKAVQVGVLVSLAMHSCVFEAHASHRI